MENPKKQLVDRILTYRRRRSLEYGIKLNEPLDVPHFEKRKSSLEKGIAFEKFIVRKFDPQYFTLIEWRSDKCIDGIFPLMSKFPDLEFYFESKTHKAYFALECKWREYFNNHKVLLDDFQIENYKHYQSVTGTPTFIVLGIGNAPSNPNQIYLLPLKDITNTVLHEFQIETFKRSNVYENFFFDAERTNLR
jgi:hypothetical protein